jgi:hypothetical protein
MRVTPNSGWLSATAVALALLLFSLFSQSGRASPADASPSVPRSAAVGDDRPVIDVNLVSFDPVIGDVKGRLTVVWPSQMLTKDYGLYHNALLLEGNSIDDSIWRMQGNEPFVTFNSTIRTLSEVEGEGSQYLYPFDVHRIKMKIGLVSARDDDTDWHPLPFDIDCTKCSFEDFTVTSQGHFDAQGYYDVEFTIVRTLPTKLFAISLNIIMVLISLMVLIMAFRILLRRESPEVSSLGFIGGLLFAIPAVRELQPKVPSMGLLIDYIGFFWAEGFLVTALLVVMICWLLRGKSTVTEEIPLDIK